MNYGTQKSTIGSSNKQIYDCCAYNQYLQQSVDPLYYEMYFGKEENCHKCIDKSPWYRQDIPIVNIESELLNITRPLSKCDVNKYNPYCKTSPQCISTFDPNIPRVLSPSLCPIVYNNIPIQTSVGYSLPNDLNICKNTNGFTEANSVNTFNNYTNNNQRLVGSNNSIQSSNMFLNSCSNQPLYNNTMANVKPYSNSNVTYDAMDSDEEYERS